MINNFNEYNLRQDKGEIYESFIFNELNRLGLKTQFFNEQNRYEIDFVYEKDGEIIGIECKSKLRDSKLNSSIKKFIQIFKPKKIIIFNENLDDEIEFEGCRIIFTHYLNVYHIENI